MKSRIQEHPFDTLQIVLLIVEGYRGLASPFECGLYEVTTIFALVIQFGFTRAPVERQHECLLPNHKTRLYNVPS